MNIDVEGAKRRYLSQWFHCPGKQITAVDSALVCECGARFDWQRTLGEDVALAVELGWLSVSSGISVQDHNGEQGMTTEVQPEMF